MDTGQIISLDASRARRKSEQDEGSESAIVEQVRDVLRQQPGLSARGIAKQLACSPTTAAKWKEVVEREQERQQHDESSAECVNH